MGIPGEHCKQGATDGETGFDGAEAWKSAVDACKLRVRSELSLEDWHKFGFAEQRAAEFDALCSTGDVPEGAVPRIRHGEITQEEFWERFESPAQPCIFTSTPEVEDWPAWRKWSWKDFLENHGESFFKAGKDDSDKPVRLRLEQFFRYMQDQRDDSPVYLFDNKFGAGSQGKLLKEYRVPSYFPDDYMALAREDRPPYKWIGVGPRRSGTVMHQDPLCTSAWNTTICGRKRWVLLPPDTPRSVAKARSLMKKGDDDEAINYFLDLLPRLRETGVQPIEVIQHPGDTIYVPGNWWHCVVNLDDTLAVTQNYCGRINFPVVWRSARKERPCWSHKWLAAMDKELPEVAAKARELNEMDKFDMQALLESNRKRRTRRTARRGKRAKRALCMAKRKAALEGAFDEAAWWKKRRRDESSDSSGDSTVSTSSSDSVSSSTSSGKSDDAS